MSGGIDGLDQFDALLGKLDALDRVGQELPETVAMAIGDKARAQYAAGRSPSGETWALRKKDGGRALANAPAHVRFVAFGDLVMQDAPDHYRFHRTGTKKMVKRNVYAEAWGLPASWKAAVDEAIERKIHEAMR